jgi:hypothetical protein
VRAREEATRKVARTGARARVEPRRVVVQEEEGPQEAPSGSGSVRVIVFGGVAAVG